MTRRFIILLALWCPIASANATDWPTAPEFTQTDPKDWLNSAPLRIQSLQGQVVLIDFWAFACWNCYRSFPWLTAMERKLNDEAFTVIGVHSPEFEREKDRDEVARQAKKFGLTHPIMIDNDFHYWRAMNNRYWPTYYLIDAKGRIRQRYIGETHAGDAQAKRIEADIRALLIEARQDN
ncbi:MAG: redoxin family protein [Pseudomonadota bacterium]